MLAFFSPAFRVAKRSSLLAAVVAALLLAGPAGSPVGAAGPERASAARLIAPAKVCPNRTAKGGRVAMKRARRSMVCMVNFARRKKNLRTYRNHRKLTWSAGRKAADIRRCSFSHTACGRPFDFWIRRSGYISSGGWATGENIAWGSGSLGRVRPIFIAWMRSKGHRAAILSRSFSDVGAGVVKGNFQGVRGARIWVLHFGDN